MRRFARRNGTRFLSFFFSFSLSPLLFESPGESDPQIGAFNRHAKVGRGRGWTWRKRKHLSLGGLQIKRKRINSLVGEGEGTGDNTTRLYEISVFGVS